MPSSTDENAEINAAVQFAAAAKALEAGDLVTAERTFSKLRDVSEFHERCQRGLLHVYLQQQQHADAIAVLIDLIERYPQELIYVSSLNNLAADYATQVRAHEHAQRFVDAHKSHAQAHVELANANRAMGAKLVAARHYERALELRVDHPQSTLVALANVRADLGEHSIAIDHLDRALRIDARFEAALFNRASLLEELGQNQAAAESYRALLELNPDAALARARFAQMQPASIELVEQLRDGLSSAQAAGGTPPEAQAALAYAAGKICDELGDYAAAFERYSLGNTIQMARQGAYDAQALEQNLDQQIAYYNAEWVVGLSESTPVTASPIFVCGMFRSGSTLLEHMLGTHSRLATGGEIDYFQQLARRLADVVLGPLDTGYAQAYLQLLVEMGGSAKIELLNKRPDNLRQVGVIKSLFPNAKIVITRRRRAENCLSVFFTQLGADMNYATSLDSTAHYYTQMARLTDHWQALFPDSVTVIDYESLVIDPETQLERVYAMLGLPMELGYEDFSSSARPVRTASVWQVRKPLYRDSIGRAAHYVQWLPASIKDEIS